MKFVLDVVIPVKYPSKHLSPMRKRLTGLPQQVRVNYVIDVVRENNVKSQISSSKDYEREFIGQFGSPGIARNFALSRCDSEYICFWDVDDQPNVEQSMQLLFGLKTSNRDLGIGNWSYHNRPDDLQGVSPLAVGMSPGIWRFIFKRDLISNTRFSNFKWGEDQLFLLEIFSKNPSVFTDQNSVYNYVKHVEGALTTKNENVADLIKVNSNGLQFLGSIRGSTKICCEIMYLKQIYTVFKHGRLIDALRLLSRGMLGRQGPRVKLFGLLIGLGKVKEW